MKYVNLGCGSRHHPLWINFDIAPSGPGVIAHDLSRGIPLPDDECDAVYHSHLLEHLRRPDALRLMRECHRVLKPGGVLRVAVPDLERICRVYLEKLEAALRGEGDDDYEWILLEMFDQAVREKSGGEMAAYLSQSPLPNESFVYERIGEEGRELVKMLGRRPAPQAGAPEAARPTRPPALRARLRGLLGRAGRRLARRYAAAVDERALNIGRFRLAGEVHQWMYDRYSLARLMLAAGLQNPVRQTADRSLIPDWSDFNLDTLPGGVVVKPDSLFMEAVKPLRP